MFSESTTYDTQELNRNYYTYSSFFWFLCDHDICFHCTMLANVHFSSPNLAANLHCQDLSISYLQSWFSSVSINLMQYYPYYYIYIYIYTLDIWKQLFPKNSQKTPYNSSQRLFIFIKFHVQSIQHYSLQALEQSYGFPSASEISLINMGKTDPWLLSNF